MTGEGEVRAVGLGHGVTDLNAVQLQAIDWDHLTEIGSEAHVLASRDSDKTSGALLAGRMHQIGQAAIDQKSPLSGSLV